MYFLQTSATPLSVLLGTWNLLNAILAADEFVFGKRLRESGAAKNHFSRGFSELLKPHIFVLPARDFLPLLEWCQTVVNGRRLLFIKETIELPDPSISSASCSTLQSVFFSENALQHHLKFDPLNLLCFSDWKVAYCQCIWQRFDSYS